MAQGQDHCPWSSVMKHPLSLKNWPNANDLGWDHVAAAVPSCGSCIPCLGADRHCVNGAVQMQTALSGKEDQIKRPIRMPSVEFHE